ncbi:MAG: DNA primase [Abditibacteriota bacterium]|nr:DNA primase [Abditibacteriota bacterium]
MAEDYVGEIKSRLNIVDVISKYVSLKKQGSKYLGLCPFHSEKTPSFNVDPKKQFFKCFGCGEAGDIFSFIQKKENLSFPEALELLAREAGVTIRRDPRAREKASEKEQLLEANSVAADYFALSLKNAEPAVISYLSRRGIDSDMIARFGLGWAPDKWDGLLNYLESKRIPRQTALKAGLLSQNEQGRVYDCFRGRLMFPIRNILGQVIAFGGRIIDADKDPRKYLNTSETPLFTKGKEFYALDLAHGEISAADRVIIVEGYMDVIACHSAGITNAVATLGTAMTTEHIKKLARYTRNVILCFDADKAGVKAAFGNGELLLAAGMNVKCAGLPEGEDPDSLIRSGGFGRFADILAADTGLLEFEIRHTLKGYDLSGRQGRMEALNAVMPIIAKEPNGIKRDALIGDVAYLHPRYQTGANAEEQIRKEVDRLSGPAPAAAGEEEPFRPDARSKYFRAQELLLAGAVQDDFSLSEIFSCISTEYFAGGFFRRLAELLKAHCDAGESISFDDLTREIAENGLQEPFYTMLADTELLTGSPAELMSIIKEEALARRTDRKKELTDKLSRGELKASDPEYQELLTLMKSKGFSAK